VEFAEQVFLTRCGQKLNIEDPANSWESFKELALKATETDDLTVGQEFAFTHYSKLVTEALRKSVTTNSFLDLKNASKEKILKMNIIQLTAFINHDVTMGDVQDLLTRFDLENDAANWESFIQSNKVAGISPFLTKCLQLVMYVFPTFQSLLQERALISIATCSGPDSGTI
jgi:hypothetical protein